MPYDFERSRQAQRKIAVSQREHTYNIMFSGDDFEVIRNAVLLNRRMLGRSPEHEYLDRAFTLVATKLMKDWESTPEAQALMTEYSRAAGLLKE